ncbi:MAG: hypothetical protein ACOZCO_07445 [Bacteroidota bacterium]
MRTVILAYILNLLVGPHLFGQTNQQEIINSTDRTVRIYFIEYNKDSTKNCSQLLLCKKTNEKPCKATSQSNLYFGKIRLDVIAIDESTNDTVYVKSFNQEQINAAPFIIDIQNSIDVLPPDFVTLPYLEIIANDFKKVFKVTDPIDVQLKGRKKIQGIIKSFDKETITIENPDKKIIVIQRKELTGIKSCQPVLAINTKFSFIHNCNYSNLKNIKFKKVHQVLITKPNKTTIYEWQE